MENITEEPEPSPEVLPGEYFFTSENKKSSRPAYVVKAVKLLIWSIVLSGIGIVIGGFSFDMSTNMLLVFAAFCIVGFGLAAFFIYKINEGANWARTVYMVLLVIGLIESPFEVMKIFNEVNFPTVLYFVQTGIQIYALVLLYKKESSTWFKLKD